MYWQFQINQIDEIIVYKKNNSTTELFENWDKSQSQSQS